MLSKDEYVRWRSVIKNGMDNAPVLSKNVVAFLTDLDDKFDQYKRQTLLSDKQEAWLESIEDELKEELGDYYEQYED